jgi:phosphoglucosamine mutase
VSDPTRLFGTDGIRAPFGRAPLDEPTVTALGRRLAEHLTESRSEPGAAPEPGPPTVVLGGDTRASTPTLCAWLARGLAAGGVGVRHAGVIPTAGVAWLVRDLGAAAGVVVSASHNPYPDNGIKLLDAEGFKWPREREAALEARLRERAGVASATDDPLRAPEAALVERYLDHLAATVPAAGAGDRADPGTAERPLAGLRIALDTGNGAASPMAGALFERLGAEVAVLHADPDGTNVNRGCGSTDTRDLARAVVEGGYHLGAAFDGDADRVILIDRDGHERDGDVILYLWATDLASAGRLAPRAIVATSMSNLGLERALARHDIGLVRCGVGDREVVETMRREGITLGGEQSGHIVHLESATTGDGLLTALQVATMAAREVRKTSGEHDGGQPLAALLSGFRRYPQVLVNVRVTEKPDLRSIAAVDRTVREVEERLGDEGRLVLRYSGTEPLARVMIEGRNQEEIETLAGRIAGAIDEAIGAGNASAEASNTDRTEEVPA